MLSGLVEGDDGNKSSYERAAASTTATGAVAKVRGAKSAPGLFHFCFQDLGDFFLCLVMLLAVRQIFLVFVIPRAARIYIIRIIDAGAPHRHHPVSKLRRRIRVPFRTHDLELLFARLHTVGGPSCCGCVRAPACQHAVATRPKHAALPARATEHFPLIVALAVGSRQRCGPGWVPALPQVTFGTRGFQDVT